MPAIFIRKSKKSDPSRGIISMPNCRLEYDENGNKKYVPCEVVTPSLACDFSVNANVLMQRVSKPTSRINVDAVDLKDEFNKIK